MASFDWDVVKVFKIPCWSIIVQLMEIELLLLLQNEVIRTMLLLKQNLLLRDFPMKTLQTHFVLQYGFRKQNILMLKTNTGINAIEKLLERFLGNQGNLFGVVL
jgi:hypothetical protein